MSQKELLALPVKCWAEENCHLYLWSNNAMIEDALELMRAWGFSVPDNHHLDQTHHRSGELFSRNDGAGVIRDERKDDDTSKRHPHPFRSPHHRPTQ